MVTEKAFNPYNLLDPFNPFAIMVIFPLIATLAIALPRLVKNATHRKIGIGLILAISLYYLVPNFYGIAVWYLVNKLHWIR